MMSAAETHNESQKPERSVIATRNYTDINEQCYWLFIARSSQDAKTVPIQRRMPPLYTKQDFRERRWVWNNDVYFAPSFYAFRARVGNNDDIGAFIKLTNTYSIIGGEEDSENFYKKVCGDLPKIPVVKTSLGGCRIVGCMCVGNKHGLIVPDTVYNTELQYINEKLPDSVEIKRIEERLSAIGNVVVCNDHIAIVHPELDKESEELIADTLQVEVFHCLIGNNPLVGSYCVLNNNGGLLSTDMSNTALEHLSSLLELPLVAGTVNSGNKVIASSLAVNDSTGYVGMKTTGDEIRCLEEVFSLPKCKEES